MNKVELLLKFQEFKKPFYTFADLQIILGLEKMSANKRIIDLIKQGFMIKIGRNIFVPSFLSFDILQIASNLNFPAYISFETALDYYNIIKANKNIITLASIHSFSKRDVASSTVVWSKIKKDLFWGFEKKDELMIAKPEKALADFLYFGSIGRFNIVNYSFDLSGIDKNYFNKIIKRFPEQTIKFAQKFFENYNRK